MIYSSYDRQIVRQLRKIACQRAKAARGPLKAGDCAAAFDLLARAQAYRSAARALAEGW